MPGDERNGARHAHNGHLDSEDLYSPLDVAQFDMGYFVGEQPTNAGTYFVVVLRARTAQGEWEAPISRRHIAFGKHTGKEREADAYELQTAIEETIPQAPEAPEALTSPAD